MIKKEYGVEWQIEINVKIQVIKKYSQFIFKTILVLYAFSLIIILGFTLALSMVVSDEYSYLLKCEAFPERKLYNKWSLSK